MAQTVVLLAEDEPVVRRLVALALQQENFVVLSACDAAEALDVFRSHRNVDVLVTDVQLGTGMNGVELAERILNERPTTKALVISGFPESERMAAEKTLPFLDKPFLPSVLVKRIREVLDRSIPAESEAKPKLRRMTG